VATEAGIAAGAPVRDFSRFAIGFDPRDRETLHRLWDEVIDSQQWTEGRFTQRFEEAWARWNGFGAVATAGWSGARIGSVTEKMKSPRPHGRRAGTHDRMTRPKMTRVSARNSTLMNAPA